MTKNFENPNEVMAMLKNRIEDMMQYTFSKSQENIIANKSSDTGILLKSGRPPKWEKNECVIKYTAPYARYVEFGTEPHFVSPDRLVDWVRRKLGIKGEETLKVAWAIAVKISQEGTEPKPFLRPALNEAKLKYGFGEQMQI